MAGELYIGIMTGTSIDGIDTVIADLADFPKVVHHHESPIPPALRELLMKFATERLVDIDELVRTHFLLAEVFASSVTDALTHAEIKSDAIRAIGLHGQTIRHLPKPVSLFAELPPVGATFQLGSGAALAALSGIDVVYDFRSADVALGGEGAPLVPMFDRAFFYSASTDRIILNIGGIANITYLPISGEPIAFDTGPGNMILDALSSLYFQTPFDIDGAIARSGKVDDEFLSSLLEHEYFLLAPPKSTGRELFGKDLLDMFLYKIREEGFAPEDAIATATELTARTIALAAMQCTSNEQLELIASGGGTRNGYLMERLQSALPKAVIKTSDELGIPSQSKEALAFAWFAKAFLDDMMIHLPSTTGARKKIPLGSLAKAG
ncbi:MAG TPA: anhydro-N-acetylmuramic acid kinase [Candidatus Kapabacteria bacterium]